MSNCVSESATRSPAARFGATRRARAREEGETGVSVGGSSSSGGQDSVSGAVPVCVLCVCVLCVCVVVGTTDRRWGGD